jgi:hypothetical protein
VEMIGVKLLTENFRGRDVTVRRMPGIGCPGGCEELGKICTAAEKIFPRFSSPAYRVPSITFRIYVIF